MRKFKYNATMLILMEEIASDEVLEQAYQWLCERRKNYSHNDDVWEVRFRWAEIKPVLLKWTPKIGQVNKLY